MTFEQWMAANFPEFGVAALTPEQRTRFNTMFQADTESEPDADADLEADADMDASADEECEEEAAPAPAKKETAVKAKRKGSVKMSASGKRSPGSDGGSTGKEIDNWRAEQLRTDKINRLCAARDTDEKIAKIWEKAMAPGSRDDEKDVELAVMRANRSAPSGASSRDEEGDDATLAETIECALLMNTGKMKASRLKELGYSEKAGNQATSKQWQNVKLRSLCDFITRRAGVHITPFADDMTKARAFRQADTKMQAAGFTQLQLNYILENVQNKVLLDAYASVKVLWPGFCEPTNNPDFKIYGRYALDNQSVFQQVGTQGQLAELKMGDRKYTTELETYGGRFSVDRKTWINDDLGAINARIAQVGILGAKTLDLNAHLMRMNGIANTSMYHTQNGNYLANSVPNYSLNITGLTNARAAYVNQVGFDNQPLGVDLNMLTHGTTLQPVANQLYTSTYLNQEINTNATADQKGQDNPFCRQYAPTESAFLNNTAILDASGAAIPHQDPGLWFLDGKQGNNAPFYIAFLNGQQAPTTLTEANTTQILGFELVVFLDFGLGYGDPRLSVCMNPNNA